MYRGVKMLLKVYLLFISMHLHCALAISTMPVLMEVQMNPPFLREFFFNCNIFQESSQKSLADCLHSNPSFQNPGDGHADFANVCVN